MIASSKQYVDALLALRDSGKLRNTQYLKMLQAQYEKPNHTITATLLAESAGYKNYNAANLHYGSLGRLVAEHIGYVPPKRKNGEPVWFWILSSGNEEFATNSEGHYEFVMRPELVDALESMKWVR